MAGVPLEPIRQHARHLWQQTEQVLPGEPYARQDRDTQPLAIVFSQDDLHPELGKDYLHSCLTVEEARKVAASCTARVDSIYMSIKAALLRGSVAEARSMSQSTPFKCIGLCFSETDVVDYFLYLHEIGAQGGGLSGSDFFAFPGHFAIAWTPDWSTILDRFLEG